MGSPRRARLLPALLLVVAGWLLPACLPSAFQAPLASGRVQAAGQRQLGQLRQPPPASAGVLAGYSDVRPGALPPRGKDTEAAWEASAPAVLAATALAAAAAASADGSAEEVEEKTGFKAVFDKVKLPVFVGLWYFFNVQYNIQNKVLLKCFDATWAVSWIQLAAGIPIACSMWALGLLRTPKLTKSDFMKLVPQGVAHSAGQVMTVASLGAVAVSFTHVVKALEPAVNAIASALILGQVFHPMVYASLLPVFAGVALASSSELSFTMFGFLTAMGSNFAFVTRNVLATKFGKAGDMGDDQQTRKTNQLAVLTMVAAAVLFPVCLFIPGGLLSIPSAWASAMKAGVSSSKLLFLLVASGFYFYMYQLSSFWVLSCVPPITHSVLNTLKRVVIIIVSIIVFRTPVTLQSACGTATAIGGVLLYSLTKSYYAKKAKESK